MAPRRRRGGTRAAWLLALAGCTAGDRTSPPPKPNVLLVVVDALRGDALGVNGYPLPTSPHLDRLAVAGVSLPRAYSHATWTKPSMATLFTSLYPPEHGLQTVAQEEQGRLSSQVLVDEITTLTESLAAAGYYTTAALDQVHLQPRFGFAQGFAEYAVRLGTAAPQLNRLLLRSLDERPRRPFFAYVHYLDVHWPYTHRLPDQDRRLFGDRQLPSRPPRGHRQAEAWAAGLGPDGLAALRARYDAEVAWVDAAVGKLLTGLEARGLLADTLVVVTSDHGEAFGERGRIQHGHAPYRELTHVPLILRPPAGWRPFVPVDEPVGLVDLMPTLLDLLGLEVPASCQGRSLAPALRGETLPPLPQYAQGAGAMAARSRGLTLLYRGEDRYEVYDTVADPLETAPLPWPCEGACARLLRGAETYRGRMERRDRRRGRLLAPWTAEDVERLRVLGYL